MAATKAINCTKNYGLFHNNDDNRPLSIERHSRLQESMQRYGFLACFPIVCVRDKRGDLIIKDGQHRLAIAAKLGLPVYWVEESGDFDVAVINSAAKVWTVHDYADRYFQLGMDAYGEVIRFHKEHDIPLTSSAALLAGATRYSSVAHEFITGNYAVTDRQWAVSVARVYSGASAHKRKIRTVRFLDACMAACRTPGFDQQRFLRSVAAHQDMIYPCATRDTALEMMEAVYNYRRSKTFPLKMEATRAMREHAQQSRSQTWAEKKGDRRDSPPDPNHTDG